MEPDAIDELAGLVAERMATTERRPFLIGIAGGVAVGKSTTARALQARLREGRARADVVVVATDGFLLPNAVLDERGIGHRKGFPESYDVAALATFLDTVRRGEPTTAPIYDHVTYDVVVGDGQPIDRPDVVIVEGVNALGASASAEVERFDLAVYVDADEADVVGWFVDRLVALWAESKDDPASFFHPFAAMDETEVRSMAQVVWDAVNGPNLHEHILPSRAHADVVLAKEADHTARLVRPARRDPPAPRVRP